jgi:hypothetical protein
MDKGSVKSKGCPKNLKKELMEIYQGEQESDNKISNKKS